MIGCSYATEEQIICYVARYGLRAQFSDLKKKKKLQDLKTHPLHFLTVGGSNSLGEGEGGVGSYPEIFLSEGSFYGQTLTIINGNRSEFFPKSLGKSLT